MRFVFAVAAFALAVVQTTAAAAQTFYYCDTWHAYYPGVLNCPVPWRAVDTATVSRQPARPPVPQSQAAGRPSANGVPILGDGLDDWCKTVSLPSSIAVCSDGEVRALSAYLRWLSEGVTKEETKAWRGQGIAKPIPLAQLDPKLGRRLYREKCVSCHGKDGQGVRIGSLKPGPLWGARSWNDGAGAARVYTLAGYLRQSMPYLAPGSLTDEEAQLIARYITSKPRPEFGAKERDYMVEKLPPDAVYYRPRN